MLIREGGHLIEKERLIEEIRYGQFHNRSDDTRNMIVTNTSELRYTDGDSLY